MSDEKMPWGKYRGEFLHLLPTGYLCWVLEESTAAERLCEEIKSVLVDRFELQGEERIIEREKIVVEERIIEKQKIVVVQPRELLVGDAQLWAVRLIEAGYRMLAGRHHPDRGGKHNDMATINRVIDVLRSAVTAVRK